MKKFKKLLGFFCAFALILGMNVIPASAANTNAHTITITNTESGHTYAAYQVFAGDISNGKLTNIVWGSGVNEEAILTALKAPENSSYASCETAEDVADVVTRLDGEQLDAFAKVVGANLSTAAGTSTEVKGETSSTYTINVTGDGYYLVKDTGAIGTNDAATKYILKVVGDVTVAAKAETPTIDKVIVNADSDANENPADENNDGNGTAQDVGSVVNFKLTSKVPAMDGYDTYTYIVNDTMSNGLTFNNDVAVTINGAAYTDFTVAQNGQSFTITFNNFIDQKAKAGKDIIITYSAIINENALTTDKETNTVFLNYSNNPNDNASKGKTPDKVVYVYDFDIVIDKYTGNETTGDRLAGAKFVLYKKAEGSNTNKYYFYDSNTKKVEWVALADGETVAAAITASKITEVETDVKGAATFQGLDTGTYYLHETAAPSGYNLLKGDVEVTITATYGNDGQIDSSSATSTNNGQYQQTQKIKNKAGATLPSTGGMGTTLFYVAGAGLVLVAVVLLITRKRMN